MIIWFYNSYFKIARKPVVTEKLIYKAQVSYLKKPCIDSFHFVVGGYTYINWKPGIAMVRELLTLVAQEVVIKTSDGAASGDKAGVMTTPRFNIEVPYFF